MNETTVEKFNLKVKEKDNRICKHDCNGGHNDSESDESWTANNDDNLQAAISHPTIPSQGSERCLLPTRQRIESEVTVRIRNQRPRSSISQQSEAKMLRWAVLFLTCILVIGIYYSLDIPAALHQQLKDYMPQSTDFETKFNLLFSVYSLPNVVLPFLGGRFVDRLGASWCIMIFTLFCFLGQFTFALGIYHKTWSLMLVGRTLYGFGGESIGVAYSTLLSKWFAGKEVALAFGVALAVARLGSVLNNLISPLVANRFSTPWAVAIGVGLNFVSLLVSCLLDYVGREMHSCPGIQLTSSELTVPLLVPDENDDEVEVDTQHTQMTTTDESSTQLPSIFRFGPVFWLISVSVLVVYGCLLPFNNVASGILLERSYFKTPPVDCKLRYPDQCPYGTLQNGSNPSFDVFNNTCPGKAYAPVLPLSINMTAAYMRKELTSADIDCNEEFWSAGCTKDYCDALHRATETAGRVMSIPYFIVAGLSPLLGYIVDKVGHRAQISLLASLILIWVHLTMALSNVSPVLPLVGQGTAYALYAAVIWPSVTLVVEKRMTGTAFGIIASVQNVGLALFPLMVATEYNNSHQKYIPNVEFFFVTCATAGSFCGMALVLLDRTTGRKMEATSSTSTLTDQQDTENDNAVHLVST